MKEFVVISQETTKGSKKNNGFFEEVVLVLNREWKSHTNLTHAGKYFRPSKVKITSPTLPK